MFLDILLDVYSDTFPKEVLMVDDTPIPNPVHWQDVDGDDILDVDDNPIEVV